MLRKSHLGQESFLHTRSEGLDNTDFTYLKKTLRGRQITPLREETGHRVRITRVWQGL